MSSREKVVAGARMLERERCMKRGRERERGERGGEGGSEIEAGPLVSRMMERKELRNNSVPRN